MPHANYTAAAGLLFGFIIGKGAVRVQKLPLKHKNKMKLPRGRNGVTLMELVVAMALFAIISTFAVTMALSVNTKTNNGIGTVGAANEMKRAERLIENWFYSSGSGNNMRCVNVIGGMPDSPVATVPATTTTTTPATTPPTETNPTAATTIKSGTLLDWSTVTYDRGDLKISGSGVGYSGGTNFDNKTDGWVSYKSTIADKKENLYFWGFPSGYSSHTGFRFKAYASEDVTLNCGSKDNESMRKQIPISTVKPSDYYYIETSDLNGAGGNITFYPSKANVTIYISDIEWYDEVAVSATPAAAAETNPTAATTIQSETLLKWSDVTYNTSSQNLVMSGSNKGHAKFSVFDTTSKTGWVRFVCTGTDENSFYFWGFPSGYSSHTGFRFRAYASEEVTLNCGRKGNVSMQKPISLLTADTSNYYYIETSNLDGEEGNITFYPSKANVTIYISDIQWYDEVEVTTTTTTATAANTTVATTETPAEPPHSPININIQNGVIVIMNSGSSNESYLVFNKDNMTVSCGDQYESEKLDLKKSQGLKISTNGTLLKLEFETPDFPFNKRVMLFAKRTTD